MATIQFLQADRPAFPTAVVAATGPVVLLNDNPAMRVGGANFATYATTIAYSGRILYAAAVGCFNEATTPAGCTRAVFDGYSEPGLATCDATKNGVLVGTCDQSKPSPTGTKVYFEFLNLVPGDIVRLTETNTNSFIADRITFYPS